MKTAINFTKASFKDFENIPDLNAFQRAEIFHEFTTYMENNVGILRKVIMSFRGKRSMYLAGGRVQQMLFQRFKVSY